MAVTTTTRQPNDTTKVTSKTSDLVVDSIVLWPDGRETFLKIHGGLDYYAMRPVELMAQTCHFKVTVDQHRSTQSPTAVNVMV